MMMIACDQCVEGGPLQSDILFAAIYGMLGTATKDEKIQLSIVLSRSGDTDSVPSLEALSRDPDPDVAAEGIRSLRTLRARLR